MRFLPSLVFSLAGNTLGFWLIANKIFSDRIIVYCDKEEVWWCYFIIALFLGFINFLIKPLIKLVFSVIAWITFGLLNWAINILLIWLLEFKVNFFEIWGTNLIIEGGLTSYILIGLTLGIINSVINWFTK